VCKASCESIKALDLFLWDFEKQKFDDAFARCNSRCDNIEAEITSACTTITLPLVGVTAAGSAYISANMCRRMQFAVANELFATLAPEAASLGPEALAAAYVTVEGLGYMIDEGCDKVAQRLATYAFPNAEIVAEQLCAALAGRNPPPSQDHPDLPQPQGCAPDAAEMSPCWNNNTPAKCILPKDGEGKLTCQPFGADPQCGNPNLTCGKPCTLSGYAGVCHDGVGVSGQCGQCILDAVPQLAGKKRVGGCDALFSEQPPVKCWEEARNRNPNPSQKSWAATIADITYEQQIKHPLASKEPVTCMGCHPLEIGARVQGRRLTDDEVSQIQGSIHSQKYTQDCKNKGEWRNCNPSEYSCHGGAPPILGQCSASAAYFEDRSSCSSYCLVPPRA